MLKSFFVFIILLLLFSCVNKPENTAKEIKNKSINFVKDIPLPKGFNRLSIDSNGFECFLRNIKIKNNNVIYYYNEAPKENQSHHYKILDISVSKKDLQQCADAVMRIRAEYFFSRKEFGKIQFRNGNKMYSYIEFLNRKNKSINHTTLLEFMEFVFINCGTYSLVEMLHSKTNKEDLEIGDVFVKAGSPGHAMLIVDVAINKKTNEKIFLLAQSFMPAQSIHIVKNLNDVNNSPWYFVNNEFEVKTPGYTFNWQHLKTW